ncbi:TIGR03862 family flavoprotein [Pararhizobium sp. IMCC21322]|uniref:NAD(P)/FAD-dependent oxidoreductase n=1 Tax=Pararhizobium sp. IMCC21322 TaxID=3067903 RepID=UPI0027407047|nr:TIGR03862 family flavoprotein [Pararhizobium sp. IMCC21322]
MAEIAIIGAGPAGLMAAEVSAAAGHQVTIYEKMPSPARKFLMAGLGGLNITHSGSVEALKEAYFHASPALCDAIDAFPPDAIVNWMAGLGEPAFTGSSGKIFPHSFKTSPLLRAWLRRLEGQNVRLLTRHVWMGFDDSGALLMQTANDENIVVKSAATVFAMGGASWPRLGSNGAWADHLGTLAQIEPMLPSNMGINIGWTDFIKSGFAGAPLKAIQLHLDGTQVAGEALITRYGLEGTAIYALSARLRQALAQGLTTIHMDLRPALSHQAIVERLSHVPAKQSVANRLRRALKFSPAERALLHEAGPLPKDLENLASRIKQLPLRVDGFQGLERAISTAGGISENDLTENFMFSRQPGLFAAGEMLNFDAPTGGYLLQAALASGRRAGHGAVDFLAQAEV